LFAFRAYRIQAVVPILSPVGAIGVTLKAASSERTTFGGLVYDTSNRITIYVK
jgi:hypothetical protein